MAHGEGGQRRGAMPTAPACALAGAVALAAAVVCKRRGVGGAAIWRRDPIEGPMLDGARGPCLLDLGPGGADARLPLGRRAHGWWLAEALQLVAVALPPLLRADRLHGRAAVGRAGLFDAARAPFCVCRARTSAVAGLRRAARRGAKDLGRWPGLLRPARLRHHRVRCASCAAAVSGAPVRHGRPLRRATEPIALRLRERDDGLLAGWALSGQAGGGADHFVSGNGG
mmetsp:Transcript_112502/g.363269  ORF Transcript_112502/g.363269 Transcript_112502/m.363269 type:complete len:227 (+) Transcript_112502:3-683(+)